MSKPIDYSFIADHPPTDENGNRVQMQDYEVARGRNLPQRKEDDVTPLIGFLNQFVFAEGGLKETGIGEEAPKACTVIPKDRLVGYLGADYEQKYSFRDWTAAAEELLVNKGCQRNSVAFGRTYRVGFNWDGNIRIH